MPRVPSEEVQLLQVRVGVGPAAELKKEADHAKRPVSHLCKLILEDHVNMFGLPNALKDVLEADRKSLKQDMREYMRTILVERYDKLIQGRKK